MAIALAFIDNRLHLVNQVFKQELCESGRHLLCLDLILCLHVHHILEECERVFLRHATLCLLEMGLELDSKVPL